MISAQNNDSLPQKEISRFYQIGYDTVTVKKILTGKLISPINYSDTLFGKNKSDSIEIVYLGDFVTNNGARYKLIRYLNYTNHSKRSIHSNIPFEALNHKVLAFDNSNDLIGFYEFGNDLYEYIELKNGHLYKAPNPTNYDCYIKEPIVTDLTQQFPVNLNSKFCEQDYYDNSITEEPKPHYFIPVH